MAGDTLHAALRTRRDEALLLLIFACRNSFSASALLCSVSCELKSSVTRPRRAALRIEAQALAFCDSSEKYRRRNRSHFFGSWLNQRRSLVLGPTSLSHASNRKELFFIP